MVKETRVQRKKRRKRLFLKILLFLALIAAVIVWSLNTSFFGIKTIDVEGTNTLDEADVIIDSGMEFGENIIRLSKNKIEEKIEENPYVKTSKISKKLPNRIEIEIEERKAFMQVEYNYSFGILDNEGILLEYSQKKLQDITLLDGFKWTYINPGESVFSEDKTEIPAGFFNDEELVIIVSKLKDIVYDREDNIKINLYNGIVVEFGPLVNVKYKLRMLEEIMADIETKNIQASKIIMNKGEYPIVVRDEK